MTEDIRPF